jgi:hypothetical protein
MNSLKLLRFSSAAAVIGVCACGGNDAPRTPLSAPGSSSGSMHGTAIPAISREAKAALDSGNALFRAKVYDGALSQYRRSAQLAPHELTPLLGMMMVADVRRDSKLADATLIQIRRLNPAFADSSAMMSHSKIIKAHPHKVPTPQPPRKPAGRTG